MPHVSAAQAVELWEHGLDRSLPERAALLAQLASPTLTRAQLERRSSGSRDLSILALREETLGSRMACFVECRHCQARLEFALDARDLVETEVAPDLDEDRYELQDGELLIRYRLPTGAEVAEVAARDDGETARRALLERCTLAVMRSGDTPVAFAQLSEATLDVLEAAMEARDPVANASIATTCAACGRSSEFRFDVVPFFAAELFAIAKRLLAEVDVLARTYHWREADVLAMSAVRRQRYVESALS